MWIDTFSLSSDFTIDSMTLSEEETSDRRQGWRVVWSNWKISQGLKAKGLILSKRFNVLWQLLYADKQVHREPTNQLPSFFYFSTKWPNYKAWLSLFSFFFFFINSAFIQVWITEYTRDPCVSGDVSNLSP